MGVPLNHPILSGIFHSTPSSYWDTTINGNLHFMANVTRSKFNIAMEKLPLTVDLSIKHGDFPWLC